MADLIRYRPRPQRRNPEPIRALTAAARVLPATRQDAPRPEAWHPEAWFYRNTTGEVRHAETWLGGSMGSARLFAGRRREPGATPTPLPEDHPAQRLIGQLAGGVGGQAALLRSFGTYLMTPGVGYMCGFNPRDGGGFTWQVRSAEQLRLSSRLGSDGRPMYEVQVGEAGADWLALDGGIVVKVYRPDPQHHWRPDSPVRGAFPILKELFLLTQSIEANAISRLAGAGLLALPQEMTFPAGESWETWVAEFMTNITTPIQDRDSAAAVVPFVFRTKGELIDKIKHLTFASPFDEYSITLRAELLGRLATAMDVPTQALQAESENHWGRAQTKEEGQKLHTEPALELVCDGVTKGYLLPGLVTEAQAMGAGFDLPADGRLAETLRAEDLVDAETGEEIVCWYDLTDYAAKADKSEDARNLWDRIQISGEVLRGESGLSEAQAPSPDEIRQRLLLEVAQPGGDATLQRAALIALGVFTESDVPLPAPAPAPGAPVDEEPEDEQAPPVGPTPATSPNDPPPSRRDDPEGATGPAAVPVAAGTAVAVVAASFPVVHRALERMGNRLRNVTRAARQLDPRLDAEPHRMHTVCNVGATYSRPLDGLLDGAWDQIPEIATRLGVDPAALTAALDDYVRGLVRQQVPHSWELLAAYLGSQPAMVSPAARVLELARRAG